jgi:hypothetical protein
MQNSPPLHSEYEVAGDFIYIIVFLEKSPSVFKEYPEKYVHYFKSTSDTGLELECFKLLSLFPLIFSWKNFIMKVYKTNGMLGLHF